MDPGANAVTDAARFHQRAHQKNFHFFQTSLLKLTKTPAIDQVVMEHAKGSESLTNTLT
jgi:hypothetical protein